METIDVIIITYNQADKIAAAIESAKSQIVDCNVNITVGNDCSTDNTLQILNEYANQISIFTPDKNIGASKNLANLLSKCTGDYIAILEGDDYWISNNKLQKQVDFLREHSECIGCGCDIKATLNPSWIRKRRLLKMNQFNGIDLCCQTSTLLFRKIEDVDYSFLWKAHRNISDRLLQAFLLTKGHLYRLPFKDVAYNPNDYDNLTKAEYNKPNCFLTDTAILQTTLTTISKNNANKQKFAISQRILFGKAYRYMLFSKDKKLAYTTIKSMADATNHKTAYWNCQALFCIILAAVNKLR